MNVDIFKNNGKLQMLALDHRGSFRKLINKDDPDSADEYLAIEIKKEIIEALYDQFSGILIDSDYGLPAYQNALYKDMPYLLAIEETGYKGDENERITSIEYSAEQLKNLGAAGVKLLLYFNPTVDSAERQIETAKNVLNDAQNNGLPLFLEIVTYNDNSGGEMIVNSVKMFLDNNITPDVFKVEYPKTDDNCKVLGYLLSEIPWILLTRGVEFDKFCQNLKAAKKHGCSGFLAGRSLWKEGVSIDDKSARIDFFNRTTKDRFSKISEIINELS